MFTFSVQKSHLIKHIAFVFGVMTFNGYAGMLTKQNKSDLNTNPIYKGAETVYLYHNSDSIKDDQWNSMEQAILGLRKGVKIIENKAKIKGNWGKLQLKLDAKEGFQKANLKYLYNF